MPAAYNCLHPTLRRKAIGYSIRNSVRSSALAPLPTSVAGTLCVYRLFAYSKGGNFNIHICACLALSSAKQGKSGSIYNLVKINKVIWVAQTRVHFMKILTVYTLNSHRSSLIWVHNVCFYDYVK